MAKSAPRDVLTRPPARPSKERGPQPAELFDALYDLSANLGEIKSFAEGELAFTAENYSLRSTFRRLEQARTVAELVLREHAEAIYGEDNPYAVER